MINIIDCFPVEFKDYKFDAEQVKNVLDNYSFTNGRPITKSMLAWWAFHNEKQDLLKLDTQLQIEHIFPKKRQENEKVFQKRYNSMFKETGLKEYLDQQGIEKLVLCGMQTEYCVDTSVKVAFEHGYKLVVPEGTVTTFDGDDIPAETINEFYENIWDERFADVLDYKTIF